MFAGPWLDRHHGKDHLLVLPNDMGRCGATIPKGWIAIQHFGAILGDRVRNCDPIKSWGLECELSYHIIEEQGQGHHGQGPCHVPQRDIVVPPPFQYEDPDRNFLGDPASWADYGPLNATLSQLSVVSISLSSSSSLQNKSDIKSRSTLLFFAGNTETDKSQFKEGTWLYNHPQEDRFSLGVRQIIYRLYHNHTRFKLIKGHLPTDEAYARELRDSEFCLAPSGMGFGGRFKAGVAYGSIPVIIQPDIRVEWEGQLPLHEYALRLQLTHIHK